MKQLFSKKNRALLSELVRTDFKLRYQGSVLGYIWSLLNPLLFFLIMYIVFVYFLKIGKGIPHYPIYLLLGIVCWYFFREMTSQSLTSIVGRGDLIRKIRIPRWIIIISISISAMINLILNLIVVFVFLFANHVHLQWSAAWLPLILLEIYIFALGVSLFLSAAYVKFRDLSYIWDVLMQAGFYLTPIAYPIANIPKPIIKKLMFLNPMAQAIQDGRRAVVSHDTITASSTYGGGWYKFVPFAVIVVVLVGGVAYFRKESKYFAENI